MTLWDETKSIPISRSMIWEAYKKVRANKGSAGVDSVSMVAYASSRRKHLYKLWNRMASGSYFPLLILPLAVRLLVLSRVRGDIQARFPA